jgi:hypothetical protein
MYFSRMKWLPGLFIIGFIIGCNEASDKPALNHSPDTPKRDTAFVRHDGVNPFAARDLSPMDISYFPTDYPVRKMTDSASAAPVMRVIYSRPLKQGRKIFGSLLKYGEPWRLGANEATEIELFRDVTIQNRKVAKGRYILYCIPEEKTWTIIFNSRTFTWGLRQDPAMDVYRFTVPVLPAPQVIEYFTMTFQPSKKGAHLIIAWDDSMARLPIDL